MFDAHVDKMITSEDEEQLRAIYAIHDSGDH